MLLASVQSRDYMNLDAPNRAKLTHDLAVG